MNEDQANREAILRSADSFADLLGSMHAMRFTGAITVHVLNGQPQMAEVGRPLQVRFPEHPANKKQATKGSTSTNSVDRDTGPAASSSP